MFKDEFYDDEIKSDLGPSYFSRVGCGSRFSQRSDPDSDPGQLHPDPLPWFEA